MPELPIEMAEIVRLAQRSTDLLYDPKEELRGRDPRQELRLQSADLALAAAARVAAHVGAIGLVPDVRRWADGSPTAEEPISIPHTMIDALAVSVLGGLDVAQLEPVLGQLDDWMIAKVVAVLDPEHADALALLQRLADDPRADVATAACRRLGPRRQWRWWAGILEHDPSEAHADDPAIVDALARACAALGRDNPAATPGQASELRAAVEGLPASLAIPLLEAGVRTFPFAGLRTAEPDRRLLVELHALGGVDALERALRRMLPTQDETEYALQQVVPWFVPLPDAARIELALRLLKWTDDADVPTCRGVARFVGRTWPRSRAPVPLIEWLIEHGRSRHLVPATLLRHAIQDCRAELEVYGERLLELAQAEPVLLSEMSELYTALGEWVPEDQLRRLVDIAAASTHKRLRVWALEHRTARLAPTDAAEREALAEAWLADPQMRELIADSSDCCMRLLPWLRRRLRAGALSLAEANKVMSTIGQLYGGVLSARLTTGATSELEAAEERKQKQAMLGVWVDVPTGPPTAEEWTRLRALAHELLATSERPMSVLMERPVGPWRPEDLALLDELEPKVLPSTHGVLLLYHFEQLLKHAPPPDASARAKRVLDRWQGFEFGRFVDVKELRRLANEAPSEQESARVTAPDWMDEEDHEP